VQDEIHPGSRAQDDGSQGPYHDVYTNTSLVIPLAPREVLSSDLNLLVIDSFLEFLATFEKREFFRFDGDFFTGFGVPARIAFVFLDEKAAETADFNPVSLNQGIRHGIKEYLDNFSGFSFGNICVIFQCGDQLQLIHNASFIECEKSGLPPACFFTKQINKRNLILSQAVINHFVLFNTLIMKLGCSSGNQSLDILLVNLH
jgi:hypothetical protein